jgi:subtilisin
VRHPFRLILVSTFLFAAARGAVAQPRIADEVRDGIVRTGSASVIVGVRASFEPEGRLSNFAIDIQQRAIRDAVDAVVAALGGAIEVRQRYRTIPFFSARVDGNGLAALLRTDGVVTIEADIPEPPTLINSVPLVNAPSAHVAGATGAGWRVAVLDTGVQSNHPFLAGKIVAEACYSNGQDGDNSLCPGGTNSTAPGSAAPCGMALCDHGTHVAGIAAGSGESFRGVAPEAQLVAIQVFTNINGAPESYPSDQLLAMEHVLALAGPGNVNQVAAVNLSLGGSRFFDQASCDAASPSRKAAIDNLRSMGIATVIASGNNGFTDSMTIPGCISSAVSVGNTTKFDQVANSSNRASFLSLMAPGTSIYSSITDSGFGFMTGTSMATPHVAGAWAVLKQAAPAASVSQVLEALRSTGAPIVDPASDGESTQAIYPRINVNAARVILITPGQPAVTSAIERANVLTVSWTSGVGGAPTGHWLNFYAGPTLVAQFTVGAVTSAPLPIPAGTVGSFAVQVIAFNEAASSLPSAPFLFTIGVGAPGLPTITTVGTIGPGQFLGIAWAPGPGASPTTHRLDFFSGAALVTQVTTGPALFAYLPIPPGVSGVYGVRVTAFNGAIAGPTSTQVDFTIGPGCAVPAAPIVTGGVAGTTATVSWLPVEGASSYLLSAGTTPGGAQYLPQTSVGSDTTASASGLPPGFFAWVRVIAVNACGQQGPAVDFLVQ